MNREEIPSADMEVMINFVKTLIEDSYNEHFKLFLNFQHLKSNNEQKMYSETPSLLVKLISDMKVKHERSNSYH